jgi:hypothetical protein
MGVVYTELTLKNMTDIVLARHGHIKENEIRQMTVQAIANTGRWTIVINDETPDILLGALVLFGMDLTINPLPVL